MAYRRVYITHGLVMHELLKRETAHLHRRLNTLPNARVLVTSRLRLPEYGSILLAFEKAYSLVEHDIVALEDNSDVPTLPNYVQRLPAIRQDITSLQRRTTHGDITKRSNSAVCRDERLLQYLGLRYVVEGSTQGGAFIARRLRQNLPELLPAGAFAFWTVQESAAACWPCLCKTIDEVGRAPEHSEHMLSAAKTAFQLFIDSFCNTE
jgi:heme oxygenase (biliverdin-IX-beta and delta-forming)